MGLKDLTEKLHLEVCALHAYKAQVSGIKLIIKIF